MANVTAAVREILTALMNGLILFCPKNRCRRQKLDRRIIAETRWSIEGISARRKRNQGRMRELQDMRQNVPGWQQVQAELADDDRHTGNRWPDCS